MAVETKPDGRARGDRTADGSLLPVEERSSPTVHRSPPTVHRSPIPTRWAKVLRDLGSHKLRSLLVVLSIAVGAFALGVISGAEHLLNSQFTGAYLRINPAHAAIGVSPFDDDLIKSVALVPGVGDVSARAAVSVKVRGFTQGGQPCLAAQPCRRWRTLTLYARPDLTNLRINQVRPQAGQWPPPRHGLALERSSLDLLGLQVGDQVEIDLGQGRLRQATVAGSVHDINLPPARFVGNGFGYVGFDTLADWGYGRQFNELLITVAERADDRDHIRAVAEAVRDKVEDAGYAVGSMWVPEPGETPVQDILDSLFLILGLLGALALLLSGFLVVNTVAAILAQQTRQVGIMKAIGGRTGQIVGLYLGMALLFGLLSLPLAIPLGAAAAYRLTQFAAGFLNFDVVNEGIPLPTLAIQVATATLVPVAAAAVPVFLGTRVTVREAITTYGLGKGRFGRGPLDHLLVYVNRIFPFVARPLLISLRNTFRRKARLALTMVTLTLGGAIFIAVFSVRLSLNNTLEATNRYNDFDVAVEFDRPYRVGQLRAELLAVPGVQAVEVWGGGSAVRRRPDGSQGDRIRVRAPEANSAMVRPLVLEGRWLLPEDESALVLTSDVLDAEPDVRVGDRITLVINGKETEWTVVGIVQSVLGRPTAYANAPYFGQVAGSVGRGRSARIAVYPDDPAAQRRAAEAIEAHLRARGYQVSEVDTKAEQNEAVEVQFGVLVSFLLMMALLIALVGGMGLMGTMTINVIERTREIGVLRAIGASNGAVMVIVLVEGVLIGLISWAQASALAWPIGRLMSDRIGVAFVDSPLVYGYSVQGLLWWLAAAVLVSAVASFLPARAAARLTVREVLSYE
ncbi:MAG: ABC transporter permease [Caldilineales bacterium]|nr:ABC transporter permease [Caldilineales bacterium]MDW8319032.1 FtsX-like permease family protein [Anaerolineae bacterium]